MNIKVIVLIIFVSFTFVLKSQNLENGYFVSNDNFSALRISNDTMLLFIPNHGRIGHIVIKGLISNDIINTIAFSDTVKSYAQVIKRNTAVFGNSKIIIQNLYSGLNAKRVNAETVKSVYKISVVLFNENDRIIKSFSTNEMKVENGRVIYEIHDTLFKKAQISIGHDRNCQFASIDIRQREIAEVDFFIYPVFKYSKLKQFNYQHSNGDLILKIPFQVERRNFLWFKSVQTEIRQIKFQKTTNFEMPHQLSVADFNFFLNKN